MPTNLDMPPAAWLGVRDLIPKPDGGRMGSLVVLALLLLILPGCATGWQASGVAHYRSSPVSLSIASTPDARALLDDRPLGTTPVSTTLPCEQEVTAQTRRVSYWTTQPGLSALLTIASLGLYLPFSFIPVDTETRYHPTGTFRPVDFSVRLEAEGYRAWSTRIGCSTENPVVIRRVLDRR